MNRDKPTIIERANHDLHEWINQVAETAGYSDDLTASYHGLRAALHTLRDTLVPDEALHLSSQLPTFIRGIYFEGYQLADRPVTHRSKENFLNAIREVLQREEKYELDPEQAAAAVFATLSSRVSEGQVRHVRDMLHKEVQELWPEHAVH